MPQLEAVWPWPDFKNVSDPVALQKDLSQLVAVLQYFAFAAAERVNDELLTNLALETATEYGTLTFGTNGVLSIPAYSGDPGSPKSAEVWLNKTLHRFRGNTDNSLLYSFAFARLLQFGAAVSGGAVSLTQTLSPAEPDTNYLVIVEPQWQTTWDISAKGTAAFTLNFATAAPGGGSAISYGLIR